jgi:Ser/Thr protein kinase RdoA (MazF antagonist)
MRVKSETLLCVSFLGSAKKIVINWRKVIMAGKQQRANFQDLTPERILNMVEEAIGFRLDNLLRPFNSYINRVFEIENEDNERFIVKFYRPGRWTKAAILEEHQFLRDLIDQEISVVAPLSLQNGATLAEKDGYFYSVFPKCGGRSVDEFTDDEWMQIGRLLGRVHKVGETRKPTHRMVMEPTKSTASQLEYLLGSSSLPIEFKSQLEKAVKAIIELTATRFTRKDMIRFHGDCHFANLIYRPGESFYIIDFDDMVIGPPVQDVWMLLPGDVSESMVELDLFLEGYEMFRPFDRRSIRLIEPLRAMRFVHYMAWCAHQVEYDGETRVIEEFGTREYWLREIQDLEDQCQRIVDDRSSLGNIL